MATVSTLQQASMATQGSHVTSNNNNNFNFVHVHHDTLVLVFSFLPQPFLCNTCAQVCKTWNKLYKHQAIWKDHLKRTWLVEDARQYLQANTAAATTTTPAPTTTNNNNYDEENNVHFEAYKRMSQQWSGGYYKCYAQMKQNWLDMTKFLNQNKVPVKLQDGCPVAHLTRIETMLKCSLPLDLKCFYRIHDGQAMQQQQQQQQQAAQPLVGLFGTYCFYDYNTNLLVLSTEHCYSVLAKFQNAKAIDAWFKNVVPIVGSAKAMICVVAREFTFADTNFKPGQVVQRTGMQEPYLLHESFGTWFGQYVQDCLYKHKYGITPKFEICRFPILPSLGSDVTTMGVRIRANALFIPEYSHMKKDSPQYFWSYRIIISMDDNQPKKHACQLVTRHWVITDATGQTEEVQGPGVIGEYPVMQPGAYFEYASCTHLKTKTGVMKGSFNFQMLHTGEQFDAIVGSFVLDCNNHI